MSTCRLRETTPVNGTSFFRHIQALAKRFVFSLFFPHFLFRDERNTKCISTWMTENNMHFLCKTHFARISSITVTNHLWIAICIYVPRITLCCNVCTLESLTIITKQWNVGNYFPLSQPSLFLYCKVLWTKHVKCIGFFLLLVLHQK